MMIKKYLTNYKPQKDKDMNKKDALQRLDAIEKEQQELRKIIETPDKPTHNREPKIDEVYYYINGMGNVHREVWGDDAFDKASLANGNVYRTRKEAEREVKRRKVITKLWDLSEGFVPSWSDKDRKHSIYYDHYYSRWGAAWCGCCQGLFNVPYFATKAAAQRAIATLGDELNILLEE